MRSTRSSATERVHDQPAQRGAALAGGARRGEHDAAHGQIEIGRRGDDRGVVAAEFQQRLAEPAARRGVRPRGPSAPIRSRETAPPAGRRRAARRPRGRRGRAGSPRAAPRHRWRPARSSAWHAIAVSGVSSDGFHTTVSPHTKRDRGVPRPHRDRKVERGDDADDAERMPGLHQPVTGALGGDGPAVQLPRQADGELADVDHLLHLAEGLGGDLACLDRDECRRDRPCARRAARRAGPPVPRAPGPGWCARS